MPLACASIDCVLHKFFVPGRVWRDWRWIRAVQETMGKSNRVAGDSCIHLSSVTIILDPTRQVWRRYLQVQKTKYWGRGFFTTKSAMKGMDEKASNHDVRASRFLCSSW